MFLVYINMQIQCLAYRLCNKKVCYVMLPVFVILKYLVKANNITQEWKAKEPRSWRHSTEFIQDLQIVK